MVEGCQEGEEWIGIGEVVGSSVKTIVIVISGA